MYKLAYEVGAYCIDNHRSIEGLCPLNTLLFKNVKYELARVFNI